jgi:CubicO group peptidase (beta-lactamase class C family)
MTVHVSVRSFSPLLLLGVSLLGLPPGAPAQSIVAPRKTAPALAERLDRLAAEIDRNRIDLHVPGVALAIVRGDEVIFARGFGVADVEKKTPVTPNTPFFVGSVTKAFTATLVGMLVDDGRMQWDDPVEKYLPEFKLAVQSKDPDDRATLRDVLSHRTGFTRMAFLEINRGVSSDEILRRVSSAEALAPFRQRFLYNNVHYLAAGSAAGVAAGTSWHALMQERILAPLGMMATRTSFREAWNDARTARGYRWDEAAQAVRPVTLEMGINVDGVAPAGAISSTARDMTSWLRFLLRQGVHGGKALISPAALTTTWTPQIPIGDTNAYGLGWFVRKWQGQRLIEHGGAFAGYSAQVGLLPDSNIGFVVLTNTLSALPAIATQLVPQYLLGQLPPAAGGAADLKPYLGTYVANVAAFSNEVFTISERNGRLVLDIPSQLESALNPPRADGRWSLVMTDQLAVSFDRDNTGRVVALKIHQAGLEFEVPREGIVRTPEIPLSELQKYVGHYRDAAALSSPSSSGTSASRSGCRTTPRSISVRPTPPDAGLRARIWDSA